MPMIKLGARTPFILNPPTTSVLARTDIEKIIPHRDPFVFVDRVSLVNEKTGVICGGFSVSNARQILSGHFPDDPVFPGMLQLEAMGQLGCVFISLQQKQRSMIVFTHVKKARFIRDVMGSAELTIQAYIASDGLLYTVVGQCSQNNKVCSVAELTAVVRESPDRTRYFNSVTIGSPSGPEALPQPHERLHVKAGDAQVSMLAQMVFP